MNKMNYIKYLFLFLLASHISAASQVQDRSSINLEKVDLKSANDSIIKYKEINPEKAIQYGLYALNSFKEEILSLDFVNYNTNGAQVEQANSVQGPDKQATKLWWAK